MRDEFNQIEEKIKEKEKRQDEKKRQYNLDEEENQNENENKEKEKEEEIFIAQDFLKKFEQKYKSIKSWTINPKSITIGELFGEENEEKKFSNMVLLPKK